MDEQNGAANNPTSTGGGGHDQADPHQSERKMSRLQKLTKDLPHNHAPVGALGVIVTTAFLIGLIITLLYGITNQWPVCELPEETLRAAEAGAANANDNREATNTNANATVSPAANNNAAANINAATNTNASTNTNANTNTNTAQANTNSNANQRSPGINPTPAADENAAKLDADSVEPSAGPITGKTLVTIKGKNFGSARESLVVRFGERDAKINQITDKTISVSTPRHSEGLVDVTVVKGTESDVLTSAFTYICPPPSGTGLFWMVVMAGALGGCIHALRSLYWYSGQGELRWRWMPMYFSIPFLGAAMAMLFSLLIIAGLVDQNTGGRSQALFIIAIGGLVGMFSQQAALKLTDVANAFFTKPGKGEDAKPQESLSVGQGQAKAAPITATAMSPVEGPVGTEVKITGSGFNTSTTVSFGAVPARVKSFDSTSIMVSAPQGQGDVDVAVKSGDQTAKLPGKFKYT